MPSALIYTTMRQFLKFNSKNPETGLMTETISIKIGDEVTKVFNPDKISFNDIKKKPEYYYNMLSKQVGEFGDYYLLRVHADASKEF
jgi:hypothetical protein